MEPFIIQDFKLFIPVSVGEKNAFAHLDTGASGNMLAAADAQGLERIESRVLQGGIGRQEVEQVRIDHLAFLGQSFDNETAILFDGEAYLGELPFPVIMTLGASALLAEPLILDFKRLWIGFAEKPLREDLPRSPMDYSAGLPFITLRHGSQEISAIFDTGAAYSILNADHVEELDLHPEQIYSLEVQDPAGGKGEMPIYRLDGLQIGETNLGKCETFMVSLGPIEQRLDRRIDFVLGANAMLASALVWVLDKKQGVAYISDRSVDVYA
jgi:predicted aspartyl protease